MIKVNIVNNSEISDSLLSSLSREVENRLNTVDFEKFNITEYYVHILLNVDQTSLKLTTQLPSDKKYLMYQGIPREYTYNTSFEAKLSTIRLRIQNLDISNIVTDIDNIVFVVDFGKKQEDEMVNSHKENNIVLSASTSSAISTIRKIFSNKNENVDEDSVRKSAFIPVDPKYKLDNVIMTSEMKSQMEDALSIIKYRKKIYEVWGFAEIDPQPKAILSFWGPPGTGKTMCAHGLAQSLGSKILAVNYAEIESKYAGESPKNLIAAFNMAQESNAVLFFDEADSFLGKRISNVQSGHDQSINSLRSQMLILLENFEGVVIFATNLVKNFDKAFETRILRHIRFELPDAKARAQIFMKMIPKKLPLEYSFNQDDYDILASASESFSGRDIRNSVLDALSAVARSSKESLNIDDFLTAIKQRQESYAKLRDDQNQDNKRIADDIKNSIIEKSKQNLNEALIGVAIYAAWSDGIMDNTEEKLIKELSVALKVDIHTELTLEYMPPLSQIIDYFNTKEKRLKAADIAIRIVAIDGKFMDEEEQFMKVLFQKLQFSECEVSKLIEYARSLAKLNLDWNSIQFGK